MQIFNFSPCSLPAGTEVLRQEVRTFLEETGQRWSAEARAHSWDGFNPQFSRQVGAKGWIGMTWPKKYGGGERSALERYVVLEEMLFAGAPVMSHWIADRQSGPLLLRYGHERLRQQILPRIAKGELCFCIGLSEPDAGSDLTAIRTRARPTDGGWRLNGAKLWTTIAHHAHYMIALVRTSGAVADRQQGLSQFLIDLSSPGVTVRPLMGMTGEEHFNEVVFDDVLLPEDALLGTEGQGWGQAMAELAYERSGPERFLSSIQGVVQLIKVLANEPTAEAAATLGRLTAQLITLRKMSISIAGMLEANQNPATEACVVKDLGTSFEQSIPEVLQSLLGLELDPDGSDIQRVTTHLLRMAPAFTLRGGTREILRGIIARGLGLR